MFIGMATQVLIVRALTKSDYGAFAYALAISSAASTILSLGQGKLLSRFMAMYEEQKDHARMFGAMALAVGTVVATSLIGIIGVFVFQATLLGGTFESAEQVKLVLILIFVSPLEALDQVFVSLFAVFSKPLAIFFRKFLLAPGLRLATVLPLIGTGSRSSFLRTATCSQPSWAYPSIWGCSSNCSPNGICCTQSARATSCCRIRRSSRSRSRSSRARSRCSRSTSAGFSSSVRSIPSCRSRTIARSSTRPA